MTLKYGLSGDYNNNQFSSNVNGNNNYYNEDIKNVYINSTNYTYSIQNIYCFLSATGRFSNTQRKNSKKNSTDLENDTSDTKFLLFSYCYSLFCSSFICLFELSKSHQKSMNERCKDWTGLSTSLFVVGYKGDLVLFRGCLKSITYLRYAKNDRIIVVTVIWRFITTDFKLKDIEMVEQRAIKFIEKVKKKMHGTYLERKRKEKKYCHICQKKITVIPNECYLNPLNPSSSNSDSRDDNNNWIIDSGTAIKLIKNINKLSNVIEVTSRGITSLNGQSERIIKMRHYDDKYFSRNLSKFLDDGGIKEKNPDVYIFNLKIETPNKSTRPFQLVYLNVGSLLQLYPSFNEYKCYITFIVGYS
ncbi:hypothetical protein H8356DRAFT_1359308 [Neocallimastix lanati (nom. inval.)]|nr:hypothetical protein H8356DRAFT_1359308 [Neocallimastix sp. JGI-2020a]